MNSTYGSVRPSVIDPSKDVEIWYHYRPSRNSEDTSFKKFRKISDVSSIFENSESRDEDLEQDTGKIPDPILPGMYNLKLPLSTFGQKGIYTIYIKPREIYCHIRDIGSLAAYPDIKGIVIDENDFPDVSLFATDNLVGYRVEYFERSGGEMKRQQYYRLITSNGRCEPVSQNLTSANSDATGYRYSESGTLSFLTLTPSTSPSFKANTKPYLGMPNQQIVITNTKFDPVMLELEMVDHDIETLSIMAEGEQVRNLENGRLTFYNFEGEIYKQFEYAGIKDNWHRNNIAEIKVDKSDNIDTSLDLDELKNSGD